MWIYVILLLPLVSTTHAHTEDKRELVFLQLVTTNGLFNPLQLYPNDSNSEKDFPDGLGELTMIGKKQHYELGKQLRNYYKHFITSSPNEIDAFSSAEDRSTQSLLCLLASLYAPTDEWEFLPGFHWQPIPITYLNENDTLFRYEENCITQLQQKKQLYHTTVMQDILERDKFFYAFWAHFSGARMWTWKDVARLHDTLEKEKRFGLKVPKWVDQYWYDLKTIANRAYRWNFLTLESMQIKVGPLLELMTVKMKSRARKPDPIKVSVYMTHDWNLAALMIAMGAFNEMRPPPCATVAIEMYRHKDDGQHSVKLLFFNSTMPELGTQEPLVLSLDNCSEYCPLDAFVDHFKEIIPENFYNTCQGFTDTEDEFYEPKQNTILVYL